MRSQVTPICIALGAHQEGSSVHFKQARPNPSINRACRLSQTLDSMSGKTINTSRPRAIQASVAFGSAIVLIAVVAVFMNAWSEPTSLIVPFAVFPAIAALVVAVFKPMRVIYASLLGALVTGACIVGLVAYAVSKI